MCTINTDGEGGVWLRLHERGRRYQLPSASTILIWAHLIAVLSIGMVVAYFELHLPGGTP